MMNNVKKSLIEKQSLGIECTQLPLDYPFGWLAFVTVCHWVEFYAFSVPRRLREQFDESSNATKIGGSVVRIQRHTLVMFDRGLSDDGRKATAAACMSTDEPHCGLRKPLTHSLSFLTYGFDAQVGR